MDPKDDDRGAFGRAEIAWSEATRGLKSGFRTVSREGKPIDCDHTGEWDGMRCLGCGEEFEEPDFGGQELPASV